jgi:uracil phosphoribosyltransferase
MLRIGCLSPEVKIITAGIDSKVDPHTDSIVPGFGDFVSRYNSS